MGAAGPVIIFVLLFATTIIVGFAVLMYIARCVLVVVQETGVGHDEVTWPNEPIQDWVGHAALFIELLGIWIAPAALTARLLREVWLPDQGFLRLLLLAGPGLWLFFPIGLLSSLSAESRWTPFRVSIFFSFFRIAPAAFGFYVLTAILLGIAAAPWYYAIHEHGAVLLPVAAAVGGAVVLIYARLLGRVAYLIQRLPSARCAPAKVEERPAAKPAPHKPARPPKKKKRRPAADVQDPWAVPEEEKPQPKSKRFPWAEEPPPKPPVAWRPPTPDEIEGYGIAAEQPAPEPQEPEPKAKKHPMYPSPEEYEPLEMRPQPASDPAPEPAQNDPWFAEQVRQRIAERTRTELPPPPHPLFSGVYTFPLYPQTVPYWLTLSLALLVIGGLLYALFALGSSIFGWGT
jgi:hypothetical protein